MNFSERVVRVSKGMKKQTGVLGSYSKHSFFNSLAPDEEYS